MRTVKFKLVLFVVFAVALNTSFAQQKRTTKKKTTSGSSYGNNNSSGYGNNNNSGYGNTTDTTKPNNSNSGYGNNANNTSSYGNTGNTKKGIDTTLPIEVIKSSNGLLDSVKMSLRNDAGVEQNLIKDKAPLAYENIREDDAVYRVRVWREIDAREKLNLPFRYSAEEDNGNQRFISVLLRAIKDNEVTAFSGDDDRFTTPFTPEQAINAFGNGQDTVPKYDLDGNLIGYQVRPKSINPDSVYKFEIKEEWIFDKESSRLFCRIIGIAPVMPYTLSNGTQMENSDRPLWWVYYPDLRPVLAKTEVYNPKNFGARMSWEDLFESRMFSSFILKSSFDNPYDLPLASVYPDNTLFRLLEGERIKEKIFNYEQSLWAY